MKRALLLAVLGWAGVAAALDHPGVAFTPAAARRSRSDTPYRAEGLPVIVNGKPVVSIEIDSAAPKAVHIAAANLAEDFRRVTGQPAGAALRRIPIRVFVVPNGKWETYTMAISPNGIDIVGSDRRGAVYGIYELSEMIGVSPWYWWADVHVAKKENLVLRYGT